MIFEIPRVKQKAKIHRLSLIIGSAIPDIIDKSMMFLRLSSGRAYFHSLLFVILSFFVLFALTKGNKPISFSFLLGVVSHLLLDLPDIPLFYPFIAYDMDYTHDPFPAWINTLLTNLIVQITEITGALMIVYIIYKNELYSMEAIVHYLTLPSKDGSQFIELENKSHITIVED
ncbi:MAG: hypothetical protein GF383_09995 [Candidatus Lokiarchaeota archaeon]|nr:hypothetical protein [Candidatus Lokiarchaeota archaeon]MBD3340866.1 hypothetical protein [Candidatus Lokiarchaeota archaeon]